MRSTSRCARISASIRSYIDGLKLTDYRVRILNAGTEAVTRVLIESEDEAGERWTTVGVSPNIIDASFQALDLKYAGSLTGKDRPLAANDFPEGDGEIPPGPMGPTRLELSKPVIAAIAGPAVAGGMELALWCDLRIMEEDAYMGVYCRRWGVPLIDGGTVRLPRIVGRGRALDLVLTGRKVEARECLQIGLCERIVPHGESRAAAEALAQELTKFPQACLRADRRSVRLQEGLSEREGLRAEWENSVPVFEREGAAGAARFASGKGRHGDREDI
jgi:enoyl-CoA hydratase